MDGYKRPVESTRDPRTYQCMDSRHETCGAYERPMDIQLYGWTAYTRPVDTAELPAGPGYLSPCGAAREPRLGDLTAADGEL